MRRGFIWFNRISLQSFSCFNSLQLILLFSAFFHNFIYYSALYSSTACLWCLYTLQNMDNKLILLILPAFKCCVFNTYRNSCHQVHLNPDFCHVRHSSLATSTANRIQPDVEFSSRNHTRSDAKVELATVLTMVQGRSPPPVEGLETSWIPYVEVHNAQYSLEIHSYGLICSWSPGKMSCII